MSGSHRQHGSKARYVFGPNQDDEPGPCRCEPCRTAARVYERDRKRRTEPAYVGADAARQHVRWLSEQGVGLKTIAKISGVAHGTLWKLVYGKGGRPSKRIRRETHDRLLAVMPSDGAAGSKVPAGPTWAAIGQLIARGWTKTAIARAVGQKGAGLQVGRQEVTRRTAGAIRALLDAPTPPRRTRWGTVQPEPVVAEAPADPHAGDDIDALLLTFVSILEDRVDQAHWRRRAACIDQPRWMFFPGRGDHKTTAAAKAVCATCPVADECGDAHATERVGIYGGRSERERRGARRETAA